MLSFPALLGAFSLTKCRANTMAYALPGHEKPLLRPKVPVCRWNTECTGLGKGCPELSKCLWTTHLSHTHNDTFCNDHESHTQLRDILSKPRETPEIMEHR